jgi:hypothetical protein
VSKTTKLYVLCAYESQDVLDIINTFERIKILMKYGCLPYIMRYEKYKNCEFQSLYTQLARWCNQPQFFKKSPSDNFVKQIKIIIKINKQSVQLINQCSILRKYIQILQ